MTLASTIIQKAYRESNLIPIGASPSANQSTEALDHLNAILLSSVGFEAGDELTDFNYGGDSEFDQADYFTEWVDDNVRLVLNLSAAATIELDPRPYEGQRFAIVDAGNTLDTFNLTIDPNGRKIEGAATLVLSTEGINRQWLYRGDTANWVRITSLATSDDMPFPEEYDPFYIIMLAARINPSYGQSISPETAKMLGRAKTSLQARYRLKDYQAPCDPGLVNPRQNRYGTGMVPFNLGRPGWRY